MNSSKCWQNEFELNYHESWTTIDGVSKTNANSYIVWSAICCGQQLNRTDHSLFKAESLSARLSFRRPMLTSRYILSIYIQYIKAESVPFDDFLYPIDIIADSCIHARTTPFGTTMPPVYNTLYSTIANKWSTFVSIA